MPLITNNNSELLNVFGEFRSVSPTVKEDKKHKKSTDKNDIDTLKAYEPLQGFSVYPGTEDVSKNTPTP